MEFYLIALLLILVIFVGTISLFYWLPKKLGYPKVGKYLAISVAFFFLIMDCGYCRYCLTNMHLYFRMPWGNTDNKLLRLQV